MERRKDRQPITGQFTERTHEENQERAYIAASRRTDRSVEARVESAKRASEIHKARTGRGFRITEQDVVNGEVYEEEAPERPMASYQSISGMLQAGGHGYSFAHSSQSSQNLPGSSNASNAQLANRLRAGYGSLNGRLVSMLGDQVSARSALEQSINEQYRQSFPNAPQFDHQLPHGGFSPGQPTRNPTPSGQSSWGQAPLVFAHTPYSVAGSPTAQQSPRGRAGPLPLDSHKRRRKSTDSAESSNADAAGAEPTLKQRRLSAVSHLDTEAGSVASPTDYAHSPLPILSPMSALQQGEEDYASLLPYSATVPFVTSTLPPNAQQLLDGVLDPADPLTARLMAGSETLPMPSSQFSPSWHGGRMDAPNKASSPGALPASGELHAASKSHGEHLPTPGSEAAQHTSGYGSFEGTDAVDSGPLGDSRFDWFEEESYWQDFVNKSFLDDPGAFRE